MEFPGNRFGISGLSYQSNLQRDRPSTFSPFLPKKLGFKHRKFMAVYTEIPVHLLGDLKRVCFLLANFL